MASTSTEVTAYFQLAGDDILKSIISNKIDKSLLLAIFKQYLQQLAAENNIGFEQQIDLFIQQFAQNETTVLDLYDAPVDEEAAIVLDSKYSQITTEVFDEFKQRLLN